MADREPAEILDDIEVSLPVHRQGLPRPGGQMKRESGHSGFTNYTGYRTGFRRFRMGRTAKLNQKNGYWYSEAGGVCRYFGKIGIVSFTDANKKFHEALATVSTTTPTLVSELVDNFVKWLETNRAKETASSRRLHLKTWAKMYGHLKATDTLGEHLVAFQDSLEERGCAPDYINKHSVTVRMMYRYGIKAKILPPSYLPFSLVGKIHAPSKPYTEAKLLRPEEIVKLFQHADTDFGIHWKQRFTRPLRTGYDNPWRGFADMLRVYHATGARTIELANAVVADFQPRARQVILGHHKRTNTLRVDQPRIIHLNSTAYNIIEQCCQGRAPSVPIFPQTVNDKQLKTDQHWNNERLSWRFRQIRRLAGVREEITIYSFRHLWISEMLMAGVDLLLIAKMAGTSVMMIEKVYGHFRAQTFQDAQARLDALRS